MRYILFPLVPFYYLVTLLRNKLYDFGLKSSKSFDVPVICVGNLSVGGTGKTPMIEYLIRSLKNNYKVATLSRGYKRKAKGFIIADQSTNAQDVGDEPFQYFKKFNDIIVSVDANRSNGIMQLLALNNKPEIILLDDAFQHRKVKAGFNIVLTSYDNLYINDMVLPTGNLREPISGVKRADIIVVTKCPNSISDAEKREIVNILDPLPYQHVFFSSISYSNTIKNFHEEKPLQYLKDKKFTLVTGIANARPLVEFLDSEGFNFEHLNFSDHHEFSVKEIENLKQIELIVTTEKDFMRLEPYFKDSNTIFYIPIETKLRNTEKFDSLINKFITSC
jgi:tetraacyldisaccharide 4'-kinase